MASRPSWDRQVVIQIDANRVRQVAVAKAFRGTWTLRHPAQIDQADSSRRVRVALHQTLFWQRSEPGDFNQRRGGR